ncbi:MAG: helix-turn-helix transcriptional regulator, partial [Leptospiraceae bacterium]|nr:helix-turn-helix transcriptional regulator [Leptospiraceae bacterium]
MKNQDIKLTFKREFVLKLKSIMHSHSLTQKELSSQTGKKPPQINRLLNPEIAEYPTLDFLIKLRELYGVDLNYLLSSDSLEVKVNEEDRTSSELVLKKNISNDWDTPILPGGFRYLKEDLNSGKDLNEYLERMEKDKGRIYISNIFPSGLHRKEDSTKEEMKRKRNRQLSQPNRKNWEFYTITSFLQFGLTPFNERKYTTNQKIRILRNMVKYFSEGDNRELHFMDTSEEANPDSFFYGFPTTRVMKEEHIITQETHRFMRVERNKERYDDLERIFVHKENLIYTSSIISLQCLNQMINCLEKRKINIK